MLLRPILTGHVLARQLPEPLEGLAMVEAELEPHELGELRGRRRIAARGPQDDG